MKGTAEIRRQTQSRRKQVLETRRVCGDHDVAHQGEACARTGSDTADRHHHRQRQAVPGADHGIEAFAQAPFDTLGRHLGEVRAGTEGPAGAPEQHRTQPVVGRDLPGSRGQFPDQYGIEGVEPGGPIEGDVRNVFAALKRQAGVGHPRSIGESQGLRTCGILGPMRVSPDQLSPVLQRGLACAYLVSGEEPLLIDEAADLVRAAARAQGYADRRVFFVERGFDWDELRNDVGSLSLFAERRLFELRLPTGKPDKGAAQLAELATRPPPDVVTLVMTGKLDRKASDAPWVQAFAAQGVWINVRAVTTAELPGWLVARARRTGVMLEAAAASLIAERVEGNLLAAKQELEKLSLLANGGAIDARLVLGAVGDSARYDVFQLAEAASAGDAGRALHILSGLKGEGVEPTLVLWAVVRELRGVWQARDRDRLRSSVRGSAWNLASTPSGRALARGVSLPLPALMLQAAETDRIIKGLGAGNPWGALTGLVAAFAGALQPVHFSGRVA